MPDADHHGPVEIRAISARDTHELRGEVLRPGHDQGALEWQHDDAPGSLHVGAFAHDRLVGIATVHRQQAPWHATGEGCWRLRGMATAPDVRRRGLGTRLLEACLRHVHSHQGTVLWCNARTGAVPFYASLGLEVRGEEFEIPGVGPHLVMWTSVR